MSNNKVDLVTAKQAHAELHTTLQQLSYKLDYPARFDAAVNRGRGRLLGLRRNNPAVFYAAAGTAAAVVGLATAAVVSSLIKSI